MFSLECVNALQPKPPAARLPWNKLGLFLVTAVEKLHHGHPQSVSRGDRKVLVVWAVLGDLRQV